MKIMTVDDSKSVRMMVSATLTNAGYEVMEASDSSEALDILEQECVNMVLADVNMPGIDGIELARRVRETCNHKYVPIIMVTTEMSTLRKFDGVSAGATGWIVKPFRPEELLDVVKKVLG